MPRSRTAALLACVMLIAACGDEGPRSYTPSEPRAFISTLGTDTLTIEVYTLAGDVLEGTIVDRSPNTHVIDYSVSFGADGTMDTLAAVQFDANADGSTTREGSWQITVGDSTATVLSGTGAERDTLTMAASPDAIPTLGRIASSMLVFEQMARQLSKAGPDHGPVQLIYPGSPRPYVNQSRLISRDSVSMDFFGSPRIGWMDERGMVIGTSGEATTMKIETRRLPADELDVDGLTRTWAAMDDAGTGIGAPSPAARVTAEIGGASIEIRYSRPAMRGREIWGGLVPFGEVWRTGANAATHMTTNRPVRFGEFRLPAGSYTLWSIYEPGEGTLIINEQTGQWGTSHDPDRDIAAIPMERTERDEPMERFTISINETESGGEIALEWADLRWTAPFSVE